MLYSVNKSPESEKYANQAPFISKNSLWFFVISNNKYVGGSGYEEITGTGLFHWRKCYYWLWTGIFIRSDSLKLKCLNDGFVSKAQLRASQDFSDGALYWQKKKQSFRWDVKLRIKDKWWFSQCGRTWPVCRKTSPNPSWTPLVWL